MELKAAIRGPELELASMLRDPRLLSTPAENSIASLLEAAERNGVTGLLLHRATALGGSMEAEWAAVRDRAAGQSAAAAVRDAESLEVLRQARQSGLRFVVLKGLALAYTVYPQPWIRERHDTDLLVCEEDVPRFDEFFRGLGYALLPHVRGKLTLPQRQYHRDDLRGFRHAWDVHWRLTSSQALLHAVPEEEVWTRAEPLEALGGILVPSRPDALLLACIHRLAHHYDDPRLIWLWDIRLLLEKMSASDLETFARLAGRSVSAAACGHSLGVARERTGVVIPPVLEPLLEAPSGSPASFLWSGSRRRVTFLLGELRAATGKRRSQLLRERLLPPLSSMRERYPVLPGAMLPLMYVWRLLAGIPKWVRSR